MGVPLELLADRLEAVLGRLEAILEVREPAAKAASGALLTVSEAAKLLSVSKARVYQLVQSGGLPAVRMGARQIRISEAAVMSSTCAAQERAVKLYKLKEHMRKQKELKL